MTITAAGPVRGQAGGTASTYDIVVLAVGAWTSGVLRANGVPAGGYRTRSIQFTSYDAGPWRPPVFVDDRSGLYGKPLDAGGVLLGFPTTEWDVAPGRRPVTMAVHDRAMQLSRQVPAAVAAGASARAH